jgi:hypothetical protein
MGKDRARAKEPKGGGRGGIVSDWLKERERICKRQKLKELAIIKKGPWRFGR